LGNGKLKPAVVDAGPIIHLKEIGCLSYLQLFPTLHIPDAVWSETVGHGRVLKEELTRLDNIQHHTLNNSDVERFIKDNGCEDLDAGERECLYLCREIRVPLILTDDLAVRDAAKQLNIAPIGSLGVVVKAYHAGKGLISSPVIQASPVGRVEQRETRRLNRDNTSGQIARPDLHF